MLEFFGRIFGLTTTMILAVMFLITVGILAAAGLLDEAARGAIQLALLPVQIIGFLIELGRAIISSGVFSPSGGGVPPTTT